MKKQSVLYFLRNLTEAVEKDAEELEEKVRKICKEADEEEVEVEEAEDDDEEVVEADGEGSLIDMESHGIDIDLYGSDINLLAKDMVRASDIITKPSIVTALDTALMDNIIEPYEYIKNEGLEGLSPELANAIEDLYKIGKNSWDAFTKFNEKYKDLIGSIAESEEEEVEEAEDDEEDIELDVEESEDEEEVEETSKKAKVPTKVKESKALPKRKKKSK